MKKFFYVGLMLVGFAATEAMAEVSADVSVNATTNRVFRGDTISARGASAGIDVKLTQSESGVFASYDLSTVAVPVRGANLLHVATVGVEHQFGEVGVVGGGRYYGWTGGSAQGKVSDLNWGEAFVGASAFGFKAEYAKTVSSAIAAPGKDSFLTVGYATNFAGLNVGADVFSKRYQTAGVSRTGWDVFASYSVAKNTLIGVTYTHAGKDAVGIKKQNQVSAVIQYQL